MRPYHDAAFHVDVPFSLIKYSSAVVVKDPGIFGDKREGSEFAVFSERGRLESQRWNSEHVRLSTLIEIKQGDRHGLALVHVKRRIRLAIDVAAAAEERVTKVSRRKVRLTVAAHLGATNKRERSSGRLRNGIRRAGAHDRASERDGE